MELALLYALLLSPIARAEISFVPTAVVKTMKAFALHVPHVPPTVLSCVQMGLASLPFGCVLNLRHVTKPCVPMGFALTALHTVPPR